MGPKGIRVVLGNYGRPHARPLAHVARSRRQVSGEDLQERGFSRTVRSNQRDARPARSCADVSFSTSAPP